MEEEYQTLEADPGTETNVDAAESTQNDAAPQTAAPGLSLEKINALTGHNYRTVEDAEKGIDNLKRLVGSKEVVKEVASPHLERKVQELEFYLEHPELKPYKELVSKFGNPQDAIKDPLFEKVLKSVKASEEKETLNSNSRITQPNVNIDQELASVKQTGDWVSLLKKKGIEF
jgi:hypothetical protein